jgi:cell wall-associated NlpC family hydrolase
MHIQSVKRLLRVGVVPALALAGVIASTSPAWATATPTLNRAGSTVLCAGSTPRLQCGQTLTASIPAGSGLQVICSRSNDYYIEVLAHRNQEGYVPKSDVLNPPSGLTDCDTTAHPAIYAAANAIGFLGPITKYGAGSCLAFVVNAWTNVGVKTPPGADTAQDWWNDYVGKLGYDWDKTASDPRFTTPPRGALVFWQGDDNFPAQDSQDGHVAISVGNGWLVSTPEGSDTTMVELLTIAQRNAEHGVGKYLGWVMPIPGYKIQS